MNPVAARDTLLTGYRVLASLGARPFLVDGTLLGAVRERGFIAHDLDLDLGVFIEEFTPQLAQRMQQLGFRLRRQYGTVDQGLELSFKRRQVKLDVFFYYTDALGHFHAAWPKGEPPIRYRYWPFALRPLAFLGHTFLAPEDPERFLRTKYGEDWRTPVTPWDWKWGPKNAEAWAA